MQPVAELRKTQINVVDSKGVLRAPSAVAIRQLTTDHSLGIGVDFTEGGKTNYSNSTHVSSMQVVIHPAITRSDRA